MVDSVNMSLDEIIKQSHQNRSSGSRGRGGTSVRGRGGGGGGAAAGGRGGRGGGGRGRGRGGGSRSGTPGPRQGRSRSRSRGPQGRSRSRARSQPRTRSQSNARSQSRTRSRSRQRFHSNSRARSASRNFRGLTPRGRAGLEDQQSNIPPLVRTRFNRGGQNNGFRGSNSNLRGGIHTRLGGGMNNRKPLAVAKRGISKRGRGISTNNRYSTVGLRSDQILMEQRRNQNNVIRSQTFTRSRNNSFSSSSQLTVSVANDFAKRRRNSVGNAGYLTRQNLQQLNNQFGGYNTRRGPGSVKSMGSNQSNRSNRSYRSNKSYTSNRSNQSTRSRGRGGNRGGNRGVGRKFVNKQILNPKLQKEIAAIQGKAAAGSTAESPGGVNFTPTPAATRQTLHERFGSP